MSSDKKDLTRIEDLGEFIHEIQVEDDPIVENESQLPDLPLSDDILSSELEPELFTDFSSVEDGDSFLNAETSSFSSYEETIGTIDENGPPTEPLSAIEQLDSLTDTAPSEEDYFESEVSPIAETSKREDDKNQLGFKSPETFEDLRKFSENSSFSGVSSEANPSFSVLIKNPRFIEDINDIILLLKEFGLLTDSEDQVRARLLRGPLLVPRVSEYTAIFLAHKLRRFDIDIEVGLSELIHKPKGQEMPDLGIVSKNQLYQNQSHHFEFNHSKLSLNDIKVVATSSMEGFEIVHYLGVASEHKLVDAAIIENEDSHEVMSIYQELANKLKAHALKANSNAVVGVNYQLTPIPSDLGIGRHKYRLSCTGNLVWANKT